MSKRERKGKQFLKQPIYKGGKTAMDTLIKQSMVYPKAALKHNIEGSVYVRYGIDYRGKVVETKVLSSLGYGCDEEACRIIQMFQFEVPNVPRKMRVSFYKNLRIYFRLPKENTSNKALQYQMVPTKKKNLKKEEIKKTSYGYTIQW